ncbi:MAG: cytochrome c3 family protein [Bryobacteraceae bacterium]
MPRQEHRQAVHRGRRGRRKQIQLRLFRFAGCFLVALSAVAPWLGVAQDTPPKVPFSHKKHQALKIECVFCHATVDKSERAGFPAAQKCMVCHAQLPKSGEALEALAAAASTPGAKLFPSHRVYRLPDFVFFGHARHGTAKVECQSCHGPVMERETLTREVPTTMKTCVDCHKASHASITCTICHELGQ